MRSSPQTAVVTLPTAGSVEVFVSGGRGRPSTPVCISAAGTRPAASHTWATIYLLAKRCSAREPSMRSVSPR